MSSDACQYRGRDLVPACPRDTWLPSTLCELYITWHVRALQQRLLDRTKRGALFHRDSFSVNKEALHLHWHGSVKIAFNRVFSGCFHALSFGCRF